MSTFIDFFTKVSDFEAGCNRSSKYKYSKLNTLSTGSRRPLGLSSFIRKDVLGPFTTVSEGSVIFVQSTSIGSKTSSEKLETKKRIQSSAPC
jgi:hypothetical protein